MVSRCASVVGAVGVVAVDAIASGVARTVVAVKAAVDLRAMAMAAAAAMGAEAESSATAMSASTSQ